MNKFEKLVEYIINEDEEQAQELFHEIVVEKSREIYNNLVSESEDQTDDFVNDIESDEYGTDMHAEDEDMDDMEDEDMDDMEDEQEEADDEELEDRVVDLEAELDALKAEFDAMMSDEAGEKDMDMDMDMEDEEVEEEYTFEDKDKDDDDDNDDDDNDDDEEIVREYVEKVAPAKGEDHKATSPVAGKNDMGGTTANIVKGGTENGSKAKAPQTMNTGNRNVPGGKADSLEKAPAPKRGE